MTTVIDDIKMGLGLQTVALPFDEPIENVIRKSFERSIRTFSRYSPLIKEGYADRSQLRKAGREDINLLGIYFLPEFLCTTPVSYADAFIATSPGQAGEVTTTTFTVGSELDLKRFLYNALKNMTSVGSGFKDIQLKIDDWASAESERNALIEKWDGRYYIDDDDLIQFF